MSGIRKKMTEPLEIYNAFDIVVIPFPFVDVAETKKRPALILSDHKSFNSKTNSSIMTMVTTSIKYPWPYDYEIKEWQEAGLPRASIVRMKLFTLDHRLIFYRLGSLSKKDQVNIRKNLLKLLAS